MAQRLAELVRKARRLAAERDRLIEALAAEWARTLRGQKLSPADLEELWAGLTEEAVRRAGRVSQDRGAPQVWRREAQEVVARIREKVEATLSER
jgi:hypothetical protein